MMRPNYKPPFVAFVKKQRRPFQLAIEDAVEAVCRDPGIGEAKTGDLQGVRVYKFAYNRQQYLMAYRPPDAQDCLPAGVDAALPPIDFYQLGTHENFYADLKRYMKS